MTLVVQYNRDAASRRCLTDSTHDNWPKIAKHCRGKPPCLPNAGNHALHRDLCLLARSMGQLRGNYGGIAPTVRRV